MSHTVKVDLPVEELRATLRTLGGEVPQEDHLLVLELLKRLNSR